MTATNLDPIRSLKDGLHKRWRLLVLVPAAAGVLAGAITFLMPQTFVSSCTFAVDLGSEHGSASGLASIATQLGIGAVGQDASPFFFARLAQTRSVLEQVAKSDLSSGGRTQRVMDMLRPGGRSAQDSLERAVRILRRRMRVAVDARTGLVSIETDGRTATQAYGIDSMLLAAVIRFNNESRQSRGRVERVFAERRLSEVRGQLGVAEDSLRTFLERNRAYSQSPSLAFEEARLSRQVNLYQGVVVDLFSDVEQARLQEARDIPAVTIVEPPSLPARKSAPRRLRIIVVAGLLALLAIASWSWWVELKVARSASAAGA